MRKIFGVVFVVLALAVPANAQYIPQTWDGAYYRIMGNQVQMLTADNLGLVSGLTDQLRRAGYRSLAQDILWNGSAYGLQIGGGFYPMYDRNRQPMGRRGATITGAVLGGAAGAGIGYGVSRNGRGTLIGTGIGAGVGALIGLATHRSNDNKDVVVTPPEQQPPSQQQVYWSHGAPVAVGIRPNIPSASGGYQPVSSPVQQGGWKVRNHTGFKVELWDGERFVILLQPGQTISLSNPDGIRGVMLIPGNSGRIEQRNASIKASHDFDGWDLLAPSVT